MLELINIRLNKGKITHVIWLCPCSCKENLRRDIIKHTGSDQRNLITICGIETLSTSVKWNSKLLNMVSNESCYLIVDESSKVKNFNAKRTRNIIKLSDICRYKAILNGTPVTRNEADLFSQMYILDWRILGYKSYWSFAANHIELDDNGSIRRCLNTEYLVKKISPYAYQVTKDECLDLPKKTYDRIYFNLTKEQEEHYSIMADKLLLDVDEMKPETIYKFLTGLQLILCGYFIKLENVNKVKKYRIGNKNYETKRMYNSIVKSKFFNNTEDNPRLKCLMNLIDNINNKCIIFCKYTYEINDIVKTINKYHPGKAVAYNGELSQKIRQDNIDSFKDRDIQFLVANKTCASYGLNLQFCSYIIFYSNDYDYGTRSQAEDRVHRIGQCNNVHIIDICAAYTLDESIMDCLDKKENILDVFKRNLDEEKDKNKINKLKEMVRYRRKDISKEDLIDA